LRRSAVVVLALFLGACASVNQETVELAVCIGQDPTAYMRQRSVFGAEAAEHTARAIRSIMVGRVKGDPFYSQCRIPVPMPGQPPTPSPAASPAVPPSPAPSPSPAS